MNARAMISRTSAIAPELPTRRAPGGTPIAVPVAGGLAPTRTAEETFATRAGPWTTAWALVALTDAMTALAVFGMVSLSIPVTAAGFGARAGYLGITWGALVATLWAKRSYRRIRRHIGPAPADELGSLVTSIVTAAWVALGSAALVRAFTGSETSVVRVLVGFAVCLVALPLSRAGALALHSRVSASPAARSRPRHGDNRVGRRGAPLPLAPRGAPRVRRRRPPGRAASAG